MIEASPRAISWVIWIERPTVEPDIRTETARLDEALRAVVTPLAERLKRAEPEFVDIAPMRLDVITDLRRRYSASLQAILAKRMREQLVPPDPAHRRELYQALHFVGWPRTPMIRSPSSDALDGNRHIGKWQRHRSDRGPNASPF